MIKASMAFHTSLWKLTDYTNLTWKERKFNICAPVCKMSLFSWHINVFFQHRCCFFTWCAFTYSGTHLYYCSRLRKLRQQRSSVSFGRLHKGAGAAEALKTEWDRCLHFHSSSIFHEDSSFKHQVKLGVQSKGLNLCSASDVWPEGAPVSLRKIIVEHTHRLEHSRKDAHISCEAPDEGPAIMLHIRRQVAGVRRWTNGGMGEHAQGSMLSGRAFRVISSISVSPWRCGGRNIISCCSSRKSRRGKQAWNVNWTKGMEVSGRVQEWQLAYAVNR